LGKSNNSGGGGISDGVIAVDVDVLLAFLNLLAYMCPYDQGAYTSVDRPQSRDTGAFQYRSRSGNVRLLTSIPTNKTYSMPL
jgi:hypothetical protein